MGVRGAFGGLMFVGGVMRFFFGGANGGWD